MSLPTFSAVAEFPLSEHISFDVLSGDPSLGPVLRYSPSTRDKRRFRLTFKQVSRATKDAVVALRRQVRGTAGRFLFTPPGGSALTCYFTEAAFQWRKVTASHYAFTVEFMEA